MRILYRLATIDVRLTINNHYQGDDMMWRVLIVLTIGLTFATPVLAEQPNELLERLQNMKPDDLAAQANEALKQYKQMTPEQKAAAAAAAQSQVPGLISAATDWWNKLTPQEKADYQKSVQGLSGAINQK